MVSIPEHVLAEAREQANGEAPRRTHEDDHPSAAPREERGGVPPLVAGPGGPVKPRPAVRPVEGRVFVMRHGSRGPEDSVLERDDHLANPLTWPPCRCGNPICPDRPAGGPRQ